VDFRDEVESFRSYVERIDHEFVSGQARAINGPRHCLERLDEILNALPELREWHEEDLRPFKPPSHLQRHATAYIIGGAATVLVTMAAIRSRHQIYDFTVNRAHSLRQFYHNHFTVPIRSIYAYVTRHPCCLLVYALIASLCMCQCIVMYSIHLKIIVHQLQSVKHYEQVANH
jgi:hypothetical protein